MGDFGVSRKLEGCADLAQTRIGTPYYLPPEICQGVKYSFGCDVWSLGVLLHELMTLRVGGAVVQQYY